MGAKYFMVIIDPWRYTRRGFFLACSQGATPGHNTMITAWIDKETIRDCFGETEAHQMAVLTLCEWGRLPHPAGIMQHITHFDNFVVDI